MQVISRAEEVMKRNLMSFVLVSGVLLVYLRADTKRDMQRGYQTATVVSVAKHESQPNYVGDNPADAPLRADEYAYNIGIRLDCNIYVGRYESPIDYLPSVFAPNHEVDVRLQKHVIFVSLPTSDREVKMGILGHSRVKDQACAANS
jgi:hypothetical protein